MRDGRCCASTDLATGCAAVWLLALHQASSEGATQSPLLPGRRNSSLDNDRLRKCYNITFSACIGTHHSDGESRGNREGQETPTIKDTHHSARTRTSKDTHHSEFPDSRPRHFPAAHGPSYADHDRMTRPRCHIALPDAAGTYHCVQHCVRSAFLRGVDEYTAVPSNIARRGSRRGFVRSPNASRARSMPMP